MTSSPWLEENVFPSLEANRRVLLVEGEADQKVYEAWLDKLAGGVGSSRVPNVLPAGSKAKVLQHLEALREEADAGKVHGIVDRDEWEQTAVEQQRSALPGLRVNPTRHCLESYFCDPADLKAALAVSSLPNGARAAKAVEKAVDASLDSWVGHWALWTTLERLKNRMSAAAYPDAFHQGITLPANAVIKSKLTEWAAMIDVAQILKDYRALRKAARRRPKPEQVRSCIYAKNVFPQVVLVELNRLRTEIESDEWMPQLATWFPSVPTDIGGILQALIR
jgi:hypothetical protein